MHTANKRYSPEFFNLIASPDRFEEIMEFNCSSGTYQQWEDKRKFIVDAFNADGTVLDIGCAGGMFLKSLQEWSLCELDPYGIDINESYVRAAKELFPHRSPKFGLLDLKSIGEISSLGFPNRYDFVYSSIMSDTKWMDTIQNHLLPMAKKRLILGFYAPNKFEFGTDEWNQERAGIAEIIQNFKNAGLECSEPVFNPNKFNQAYVYIDK